MRYATLAVLMLLGLSSARADTWDVEVVCDPGAGFYTCDSPFSLIATVTTEQITGTFISNFSGLGESFFGTEPVVTGATGTVNGVPFSFTELPDTSGNNWLSPYPENVCLETLCFFQFIDDTFMNGGSKGLTQVLWGAIPEASAAADPISPASVAESPMLPMALSGILALLVWHRRRVRQIGSNTR